MDVSSARKRAELTGKATEVLDARTLASSHRRLSEVLKDGMTVLDVGCGTGAITSGIAERVGPKGRVIGIDSSASMIDQAKQMYGHIPGLSFEVGDIYQLPYEETFDVVTAARVLQWLDKPAAALEELIRVTKRGGRVLVLDYNHEKIAWTPEPPSSMKRFYEAFLKWRSDAGMDNTIADRLTTMFTEAGLADLKITPQHELAVREGADFEVRLRIWEAVAASRGLQMVRDGFLEEDERALAEQEYRIWVDQDAIAQTMYLLAVEGTKN